MDPFSGAAMPHYLAINTHPDKLICRNGLGKLLTELRDQIKDIPKAYVSNDTNISSPTPTPLITSATDTKLQESQIKQTTTSVILENDIELFPKHLMTHETHETTRKKGRSQTKEGKRITKFVIQIDVICVRYITILPRGNGMPVAQPYLLIQRLLPN